jgi:hypothetical protein
VVRLAGGRHSLSQTPRILLHFAQQQDGKGDSPDPKWSALKVSWELKSTRSTIDPKAKSGDGSHGSSVLLKILFFARFMQRQ